MPLPTNLDFDKLMKAVGQDLYTAIDGWQTGEELAEVALLSRLIEQLKRRRRSCDVGISSPMTVQVEYANLHRKGPKSTDLYGSDLAVTINFDRGKFIKTALFQIKRSHNLKVIVETEQLKQALIDPRTQKRSFLFAVDDVRYTMRLHDIKSLRGEIIGEQDEKTFHCTRWNTLNEWMRLWLACDIGEPSDPDDPLSIESVLKQFVGPEQAKLNLAEFDLPEGYIPTQHWLKFFFR
jgi:hypothetical protein